MKQILTRVQAVAIFEQVDQKVKIIDIFFEANKQSEYFKLTNLEMENLLIERSIVDSEIIAAVVDY